MKALNQVIQALRFLERNNAIPPVKNHTALATAVIDLAKQMAKEGK